MKRLLYFLGFGLILLTIGGCSMYRGQTEETAQEEMMRIVKSEEVRRLVEEGIKNLDDSSLTDKGTIRSYKIDYDSAEMNPMGGITLTTYINGDEELYIKDTINKDFNSDKLEIGGSILSGKLSDLLREK